MRNLPPLNGLRTFEAAARHGSFQAAADELHVTPTAISHQIRHLEQLLACSLFRRQPRPVQLTDAGEKLFPALREALDRIESAVQTVRTPAARRPLVVSTTPAFSSRWLIPRLQALREACALQSLAVDASVDVADLHAGAVDFAIRYSHAPDPDLESHALMSDRYFPVCSPTLLSRHRTPISPADIAQYKLIDFKWNRKDPDAPVWKRWLALARQRFPGQEMPDLATALHFSEESHAIEAAILGQGIALLSDLLVERELANGTLIKAMDLPIQGLTFYAQYLPNSEYRDTILRIVNFIRNDTSAPALY